MTAVKSYSLDVDIIQLVAAVAKKRNMRQSAVIKEAVLDYADSESGEYDDLDNEALAVKCKAILDRIDRGEEQTYSLDEVRARYAVQG
jgi:predicted transcriptional regulator